MSEMKNRKNQTAPVKGGAGGAVQDLLRVSAVSAPVIAKVHTEDRKADVIEEVDTSSGSSGDSTLVTCYAETPPIHWSTFEPLSQSANLQLTALQEANVTKAIQKVAQGIGSIEDSLPFVSAFVERHCPALATKNGCTFLILAVLCGHQDIAEACLANKANPNSTAFLSDSDGALGAMRHGYSPLFLAVILQQLEIAQLLKKHGGAVSTCDKWGRTPLHAAAAIGNSDVLTWVLRCGAPRCVFDRDGTIPGQTSSFTTALLRGARLLHRNRAFFRSPAVKKDDTSSGRSGDSLCPCFSGTRVGMCLCTEEMFDRWYRDRVGSYWLSDYNGWLTEAMSATQNPEKR